MKFLPIICFILLFFEKAQAQTPRKEPIIDMQVERVRKTNTTLPTASRIGEKTDVMLTEKYFSDDIAFRIGKLELREEGITMLNHFIIEIDDDLKRLREQHPSEQVFLKIKISQNTQTLAAHRTNIIYSYLIERLVQAGNVQIEKEVIRESHKNNQLSCAISLRSFTKNMR